MKPKIIFFSLNSFTAIPVFRLILRGINQSFFSRIVVVECFLNDMSARFEEIVDEHIELLNFKNASVFNNQSMFQKIKKYFLTFWYMVKFVGDDSILYTCDLETLAMAILIKRVKRSNCKIVYHQFETVEHNQANSFKRRSINYVRSVHGVDLAIFPEQNRQSLFAEMINDVELNALVFPNTCHPQFYEQSASSEDQVLVGHIGNLSMEAFYLGELLAGVKVMKGRKIKFVFVGIRNEKIKEQILEVIPDAQVIGWVEHTKLMDIYKHLHLGLILYKPLDFNTDYCAPNKLYEYWAHGVPVLAPKLKGLLPVFDSPLKGKLIDFDSSAEIKDALESWGNAVEEKSQLYKLFQDTLNVNVFIEKWELKLKDLIQ